MIQRVKRYMPIVYVGLVAFGAAVTGVLAFAEKVAAGPLGYGG